MLIFSSWSERFRSDIGFNGVSQVWNDRLSWYFWLADAPGVYLLEMMTPEEGIGIQEDRYTAVFKIKCYPYQEHPEESGGIVGGIGVFGSACRHRYLVKIVE